MKIYFGELSSQDFINDVESGELEAFSADGKYYEFCLELTEEGVTIFDAIDRCVPMSHLSAIQLHDALCFVDEALQDMSRATEIVDHLNSTNDEFVMRQI